MGKTVAIGVQDFSTLIEKRYFYIDKTPFIQEWWDSGDSVTLINRPRRFGKTLNISMVEQFFSLEYADRGDLFEGLAVWENEEYRKLQGTYPVISLSFANIKEKDYVSTKTRICQLIADLYNKNTCLLKGELLTEQEKEFFQSVRADMPEVTATIALYRLSNYLYRYHGKKVIILLDEYDTPMQEAYVDGYWDMLVAFTRSLFNATFKTNPWLERGIMTGITRVSKESIFSDLNNLKVITTTCDEYATSFGFTEPEVFAALEKFGLGEEKQQVKQWYDGFTFGEYKDIYNPWSILNFIDTGKYATYWANSSSNSLVGKLIREASRRIKIPFGELLQRKHLHCPIDEQIVYNQLDTSEAAIWSLLLASGYLKVIDHEDEGNIYDGRAALYELALTNYEVERMFAGMVRGWFEPASSDYSDFVSALLAGDTDAMNEYMNRVALQIFSYFDTGMRPSGAEPERFYHGFILGLIVDLQDKYTISSNRESGFGRYDVMLEPKDAAQGDAIIMEFKVRNPRKEHSLEETVQAALAQIAEKQYAETLIAKGVPKERIKSYGFAFEGKTVLIYNRG